MSYNVRVLADSISPTGQRLITLESTHPRAIHAEVLTHRVFSRNSSSSRAIPVKKMLSSVWNGMFTPVWWGASQAGMSAEREMDGTSLWLSKCLWRLSGHAACVVAWMLMKLGLHKQIANRILEPWSFITVIISSTEWDNWFALRRHKDAQPEIKRMADLMWDAIERSTPQPVVAGEWHLPLVDDRDELHAAGYSDDDIVMVSAGRCARVSYLTHDGKRDPAADIKLAERLVKQGHFSPLEHPATPMTVPGTSGNFNGWQQLRATIPGQAVFETGKGDGEG